MGNFVENERNSFKNKKALLSRSTKAVCGVFEREITVRVERVAATKKALRKSGFVILGTSEPNGTTRKIWFNPAGVNL